MSDQSGDSNWKGDPDFLEDKFVRFSYRFKYADNERSLMAPFTQVMFIPKQDGYFLGTAQILLLTLLLKAGLKMKTMLIKVPYYLGWKIKLTI
jgi:hypothetical protein